MGAADYNTGANLKGTKEEIFAMLMIMRSYATEKREQYRQKRNCPYFMGVHINGTDDFKLRRDLLIFSDEDLMAFIEENKCNVDVEANGPYGVFGMLDEVDVFHEMAEAAPNAQISGGMGGFGTGGDQYANFELKDGRMVCKYAYPHEDDWDDEDEDFEDDWDEDDDDWDEQEEPDWDEEVIYDPVAKKNVKK